jgi:hypothetical protein
VEKPIRQILPAVFLIFAAFCTARARPELAPRLLFDSTSDDITLIISADGFTPNVLMLKGKAGAKMTIRIDNETDQALKFHFSIGGRPTAPLPPKKDSTFPVTLPLAGGTFDFYVTKATSNEKVFTGQAVIDIQKQIP